MTAIPPESVTRPPPSYTLLLIDDTPINLAVLSDYLEESGFRIVVARDGESGLTRARYARPDIILLDVMMPGIDGFETCRRLKADPLTADIPVIFMTALVGVEDKVEGFVVGAVDYVTKPLQQEEVLARVSTHLRLRELTQGLQKKSQQLEASQRVARQLTSILSLPELLSAVVEVIQTHFGYSSVGVWSLSEDYQCVTLEAFSGEWAQLSTDAGTTLPLDADPGINSACQTGQVALLQKRTDPHTRLVIPLHFGSMILGALDIRSREPEAFDAEERSMLEAMANQISIAIRNARLYQLSESRAQELAEMNASKDKFFAIIAHDLRSPFTGLLGLAMLLLRTLDDAPIEESRDLAARVYGSARATFGLLENLLQWSRLQLGRFDYHPELVDIDEIVALNIHLLSEVAEGKGVVLASAMSPGRHVYADPNILNTVLRNLISNALKFTPAGGRVTIWGLSDGAKGDRFLEIWVQDTGVGMSQETIQKLFRLDKPYSTPGTAQEPGTGLGLLLCQEMVMKNGGELWIESELGAGTAIKFTVPVEAAG